MKLGLLVVAAVGAGTVALGSRALTRPPPVEDDARAQLYAILVPAGAAVDPSLLLGSQGYLRLLADRDSVEWEIRLDPLSAGPTDSLALAFRAGLIVRWRGLWTGVPSWSARTAAPGPGTTQDYYACAVLWRAGRYGVPTCTGPWTVSRSRVAREWIVRDWTGRADTVRAQLGSRA